MRHLFFNGRQNDFPYLSPHGHTFRASQGGFYRIESYKSPGIRNGIARWIHRLLKR